MLTYTQLDDVLHGINFGISENYFRLAAHGSAPRKEILAEAKSDLEVVLSEFDVNNRNSSLLKLRKYKEIVDLLEQIPDEILMERKQLSEVLEALTYSYDIGRQNKSFIGIMIPHKYKLVGEKGKIQTEIELGGNSSLRVLVELADRYIELLRLETATTTAETK